MKKFQLLPVHALRPYIDRLWGWESEAGETVALPELVVGTGAELYFHYGRPFQYQTRSSGQQTCEQAHLFCVRQQALSLMPSDALGFIAVRFKAGMLPYFTPVALAALVDQVTALEDIWGQAARDLKEQLDEAGNLAARLNLIQDFFCQHLHRTAPDTLMTQAMHSLYRHYDSLSIEALADHFGLGRRQFERRFLATSGLTANTYKRISRFEHSLRALMLDDTENSHAIALDHGYYDQAHFNHEFRRHTGTNPQAYLTAARARTHFYKTSWQQPGMMALHPLSLKNHHVDITG
ncbi:AraC family transcriptional regulator [Undibacterium sp. TS12]|uniref:helix-turn-helix domain-containing protein n=1 Tax=Undibacterium sp. TS12 TaxID=2908202 RepID=UPI001F4C631C|nr:AraC family transcriptional regulator [Undibacterium sp. TS12]MCH8619424.1 AraC family transcriptional regulator [Undibacterium sp. TS12]